MSTSTTTEILPHNVRQLLQAYNVHHTGHEEKEEAQATLQQPQASSAPSLTSEPRQTYPSRSQPWHEDVYSRRRVPPYRETSRSHSLSSRPAGRNQVEAVIVTLMFWGVNITGVSESLVPLVAIVGLW